MTDPGPRRRRPHPALGARIAATGLGVTTLFGLVAAMGAGRAEGATTPSPTAAAAPVRTVIVVHHPGAVDAAVSPAAPSAPTALTARPVVRAAPPAASAPAARTSGSR